MIVNIKQTIEKHKLFTVFELYVIEVFTEAVQNMKLESSLALLKKIDNPCTYANRRTEKGPLPNEFNRNKIKSTSIEKFLQKGYSLLTEIVKLYRRDNRFEPGGLGDNVVVKKTQQVKTSSSPCP